MPERKVAIVTGAAGGIGQELLSRLDADGYQVVGLDRESGEGSGILQIDINDTERLRSLNEELEPRRVAAIIHNAAVQPIAGAGQTSTEDWWETFRVNVLAVDALVHAFGAALGRNRGAIVVISSVHARATTGGINAYATSKAALEGWVRSACLDLGPAIRVNGVAPGAIDTPKLRQGMQRWTEVGHELRLEELCKRTALQRIGHPTEVADLVAYLVSERASFITGTTVTIDGGASARLGSE